MPNDIDPSSNDAQHAKENAGWTYVKPKSRRRCTKPTKLSTRELPPQHPQRRSGPLRPLSAIDAEYRKIRSQWEATSCCARLRELVATSAAGVGDVSNAICLGIGTFDPLDGAWEAKRRTFIQLIAFLIIVEELEKSASNKSIKCYFQEPAFTETDILFIQSLDHQVVESPTGFDMVKDRSLLFGVHLYRPVYAAALRRSLPGMFVGTSWDVWDQVNLSQTDDLDNLRLMDRKYSKSIFPQDTSTTAFSSTCIYWRTTAASVNKTITDNPPTASTKETDKSSSTAPLGPSSG